MDFPVLPKSDPLILLLNEIEILLAQTRLIELHVKRAEAQSNDRLAQVQAQYQNELATLRAALAASEESLAAHRRTVVSAPAPNERTQALEQDLQSARRLIEERNEEILRMRAETDRIGELADAREWAQAKFEAAAREREVLETDLAASRASLEEAQSRAHESMLTATEQQRGLQTQLAETNAQAEQTAAALAQAQHENVTLRSRLAEVEVIELETERRVAKEIEELRVGYETELTAHRSHLAAREQTLEQQRSAADDNERRLRGIFLDTQRELEEQRAAARSADERLHAAENRAAVFEQQIAELNAANSDLADQHRALDAVSRSQTEEIEALRHQAALQERALTGRQEAVTAVELALHAKIQTLHQDLASSHREIEQRNQDIESAQALAEAERRAHEMAVAALRAGIKEIEERHSQPAFTEHELDRNSAEQSFEETPAFASQEETRLQAKIAELQMQVAEKQLLAERRAAEIADLKAAAVRRATEFTEHGMTANRSQTERITELEAVEATLRGRITELENRCRETDARLKNREEEHAAAAADVAAGRERIQQLEALREKERALKSNAEAEQRRLEAALVGVREELRDNAWSLARQQAALENLALAHKNQLQKLEGKLDEQQGIIEAREGALAEAQTHTQALEEQIASRDAAAITSHGTTHASQEEVAMKIDEVNQQAPAEAGEAAPSSHTEQTLRDEIAQLRYEAHEKNQILQDRNDELVRVKAQLDQLQERLAQLEPSSSDEENSFDAEAERMRTEFQAQLVLLQAELSQKEWALEERQAQTRGVEQSLRQEMESLRRQLAAKEAAEQAARKFAFEGAGTSHNDEDALTVGGNGDVGAGFASQRRWNRGFYLKRRWRS